jgi:hypothetical protein
MVGSYWLTLDGWCMFDIRSLHRSGVAACGVPFIEKAPFGQLN